MCFAKGLLTYEKPRRPHRVSLPRWCESFGCWCLRKVSFHPFFCAFLVLFSASTNCRHFRLVSIFLNFYLAWIQRCDAPFLIGGKRECCMVTLHSQISKDMRWMAGRRFCPSKSVALQRIIQPYWSPPQHSSAENWKFGILGIPNIPFTAKTKHGFEDVFRFTVR